jgi:predicted Zn-dependent protease
LALAGLGRLNEALDEGTKATQLDRLGQIAWYALANAYLKRDQIDQAIKSLDTGLAADPNYRFSYQLRAEAHRRAGHDGEAEKDQSKFEQLQAQYMANFHYN